LSAELTKAHCFFGDFAHWVGYCNLSPSKFLAALNVWVVQIRHYISSLLIYYIYVFYYIDVFSVWI